jgi:hypothetical protein
VEPSAAAHEDVRTRARAVKVVLLLAWGRSGSTILDNALGAMDGFFSAGEIRYLWERGVIKGWRCGCGRPVTQCPVWSVVLARVEAALNIFSTYYFRTVPSVFNERAIREIAELGHEIGYHYEDLDHADGNLERAYLTPSEDATLAERFAPVRDVGFIVFHDAYQYLEHRYGLNALGSITVGPERMPGARRLSEIRARIDEVGAA